MKLAPSTFWNLFILLVIASSIQASPSSYMGEVVDRYAEFLKRQARLPELKSQPSDTHGGCLALEGGKTESTLKIEGNLPPNGNDGTVVDRCAEFLQHQAHQPSNEVQCFQNRESACILGKNPPKAAIKSTHSYCKCLSSTTSSSSTDDSDNEKSEPADKATPKIIIRSTPISIPPRKLKRGQPEKKMIPPKSFRKYGSEPFYGPSHHALFQLDSLNLMESSDTI